MKNLFTQNRTLEKNTRFVWNVEVQRYDENAEAMKENLDVKEQAQHFKEFVENQEALNGKVDNMKKIEAGEKEKEDPEGMLDSSDAWGETVPQNEEGDLNEHVKGVFRKIIEPPKEDFHSDDMEEAHVNDSEAIQKPDTTKATKEKTEIEKETKESAEIDPITKLLGETKEDEGAGYHSTAEVEGEIAQEEIQGGGIGGMNIASTENFVDASLEKNDFGAEGGNVDDANNIA